MNSSFVPPTLLTDFRLSGSQVPIGSKSPLKRSITYTDALTLSHQQNIFSIEFAALSYFNAETNRYRYRLDGLDDHWHEVSGDQHTANYTTLPAGTYTFQVQGATSRGKWSDAGAILHIEILPAWYQTVVFRGACTLLFVTFLLAIYQLRLKRLEQQFTTALNARVDERVRIARELHDTLLQSFHGLLFRCQATRNMLPRRPEDAMQSLDGVISRAEEAIAEGRNAIQDLRYEPSAHSDLESLLTAIGRELASSDAVNGESPNFRVTVEGKRQPLSPMLQDELYRIARESLRNAFQHAQARHIEAEIQYGHRLLRLRIRDDGKGMDSKVLQEKGSTGHWGLPGIRERAKRIGARLDFWSEVGAGTEIELTVPFPTADARSIGSTRFRLFRR